MVNFQNDTEIMSDDDLLRLWSIDAENKNSHMKEGGENSCVNTNISISNSRNIFKIFDKIPSLWSFLIGVVTGIVIGGIGMWLLDRLGSVHTSPHPMSNSRRRRIQAQHNRMSFIRLRNTEDSTVLWTEMDTINCPDTPPPAYRERLDQLPKNNFA